MEQLKENHQATLLIVYPHRFKFQRNSLTTTTTTVAYLNLAVIQNACIIQMMDIPKVKMKRADRLLEQSKLFYENFADSLDHWYVVFKGQIEGWGANSPVQYISFFVNTIDNSLDQFQINIEMIYFAAIYLERFMNRKFKIFCMFFRVPK